jgi:hypothetical protein
VPISEKTGKDMSAATHGGNSRGTVRLHGHMGHMGLDEDVGTALDRLVMMVADNQDAGAPA